MTDQKPSPQSLEVFDFNNICVFFTAVCTAAIRFESPVVQKNHTGTNASDSWLGFTVGDCWIRFQLMAAKATLKPMRPYITTTEQRDEIARRITEDPRGVLQEMKESGGWRQLSPWKLLTMATAAAIHPEMESDLQAMVAGDPKPD